MAEIIHHRIEMPFDRFRVEYEWQGDDTTAFVSYFETERLLKPTESFWLGHLELVVVDVRWDAMVYIVALASGPGFQAAYRQQIFYFWESVRSRIILTLYVWGLAAAPMGERLTWKHVHWGRRK